MKRAIALATRPGVTSADPEDRRWLEESRLPLDWNGPIDRAFSRFLDEDMDRPIIELLERVVRKQPDRVALTDGATALTYAELWGKLSGLGEAIADRTRPGDLVGILLPAC